MNGACGTANGSSVLVKPTTNLCSTGTATALTGTGPWAWSCAGLNGGASTSCSAALLKSCTDSTGATHASGTTYSLTVSTSTGTAPATPAQCSYGGTQATTTTTDQTYTCTNGIQTAQSGAKVTTVDTGSPVCKAPAACGSTPSGSTVTNTVSTTTGSMAATTTQCAYGGTVPTKTTVTQVSLCTNGTLTAQGAPVTTTVASGSPVCTAAPVAGQCGTAIVTYSPTKPTINLCASGTASAVTEVVWPGPMQCHADGSVTMLSAGTTAGPGRWEWTCAGTGGNATVSCYASAGLPGPGTPLSTDSHTPNYVGKTDYASLPFQNTIWTGGSPGLEPMQLFAQVNPKSVFIAAEGTCTSAPFSNSRRLASIDEADGIVPAQGAQRWQGTWVNSFAANNITVNGIGTMNIPTSVANNATSNYSAIPEFAAWRDFYIQHPQYWDTTNAGGTVPSNWQSWNGQWGFISPLTPLAKADCPPDMASCTWGDDWAYRWAFTAAMSGEYGMGLSDFSDSFPYGASSQHGFNPRIIKAFAAQYGLAISGTTVTDQANWIVANAYNQWNDYLSQGYGHMFSALANRISQQQDGKLWLLTNAKAARYGNAPRAQICVFSPRK